MWRILIVLYFVHALIAGADYRTCGNTSCYHNSLCDSGGNACQCSHGFMGETCEEDFDECMGHDPCYHRGVCINAFGSYSCQCLQGWKNGVQQHCEIKTNPDINFRRCKPGWMGDLCLDECSISHHCGANQVCTKHGRGKICVCQAGWTGVNCTTEIDECTSQPCKNFEVCRNTIGSYTCECPNGWNGTSCTDDIDECTINPCKNSGTCTNTDGSYYCNCSHGWFGVDCDLVQQPRFEDTVRSGCTSTGWNISLDVRILQSIYPGITANNIYLGPSKCTGEQRDTELWFKQSFNECMTSEKYEGNTQTYQNVLFYAIFDTVDPSIVRHHYWSYNVACNFDQGESTSTHLHHIHESYSSNITGHRDISITFYKDHTYQQQIHGNPLSVHVGDKVFVKVATSIMDWNTKLRLHTCHAVSSDLSRADHMLIRDGCEVDKNTHIISQSTHETRFVFLDFEYLTFNEGFDIFCNATFCHSDDFSPECTQACRQIPQIVG
ncbi:protein crumbs-like [Ruditapes philippinarum]|uniref:protein crumbs-like n=1 Tax=Ruditapes philippinarum TaxID=129788 RepID=UPI00295AE85F|nr:protein crumbs-like [Ruditapes philippinarum]